MVGKVEEIFGPINASYFTVKLAEGVVAASYTAGDKFFIAPDKLLPMERFLQPEKRVSLSLSLVLFARDSQMHARV